jgi:aminoglycoside phosphotransferase
MPVPGDSLITRREQEFLLSIYPPGTEVIASRSYRPGYMQLPARVTVRTPGRDTSHCVVKASETVASIEREACVLRALADAGFPVPRLLAGPAVITSDQGPRALIAIEELPGRPLPWLGCTSLADADLGARLLIQGVLRLHQLTGQVRQRVVDAVPSITLSAELSEIVERGGEWLDVELFAEAARLLQRLFANTPTPLVFSNGDYNPLNFLHEGETLTGWIDFENACFEDPHIGFAKFLIWSTDTYGWGTGVRTGLVERYLYTQNVSRQEFAPRLALRCLRHLQREVSAGGTADVMQRTHTLRLLREALADLD